jgi:hypothetical protein
LGGAAVCAGLARVADAGCTHLTAQLIDVEPAAAERTRRFLRVFRWPYRSRGSLLEGTQSALKQRA